MGTLSLWQWVAVFVIGVGGLLVGIAFADWWESRRWR